jgi:hypothetical protein
VTDREIHVNGKGTASYLQRPPAAVREPMSLGIPGAQHEMPVVELPVVLRTEGQQIPRPMPAPAREEANMM